MLEEKLNELFTRNSETNRSFVEDGRGRVGIKEYTVAFKPGENTPEEATQKIYEEVLGDMFGGASPSKISDSELFWRIKPKVQTTDDGYIKVRTRLGWRIPGVSTTPVGVL